MSTVFSSAISDASCFYSFMSFTAAHRAILGGRKANLITSATGEDRYLMEPEYYVLNARCIKEINTKIRDPKQALTDDAFQTVVNLVSGAVRIPIVPSQTLEAIFASATYGSRPNRVLANEDGSLDDNWLLRRSGYAPQGDKEDGRYERII
jgi:hypothetical protein